MDVYSLINSKAISDHCRKIGHTFTPLEMAYLVHANDTLTLSQKHTAYKEIIAECPDMEVPGRTWTPYFESLHAFLQVHMELQNKYFSIFYNDDPNCVYSYAVWYSGDSDYTEDERVYSAFASCYKAIKAGIDDLVGYYKECGADLVPLGIKVTKRWINTEEDDHPKYMTVCIDYDNDPIDIWQDRGIISEEDHAVLSAFEGLWPEIPTPFQKGDILTARRRQKEDEEPFVLDRIPYWEEEGTHTKAVSRMRANGDASDLLTVVYGQAENGAIRLDHGPNYLDLEYYEQDLCGKERILLAVSNYIKGCLSLEQLMRSYDILKCEYYVNRQRSFLNFFLDELLTNVGLIEKDDDIDE